VFWIDIPGYILNDHLIAQQIALIAFCVLKNIVGGNAPTTVCK